MLIFLEILLLNILFINLAKVFRRATFVIDGKTYQAEIANAMKISFWSEIYFSKGSSWCRITSFSSKCKPGDVWLASSLQLLSAISNKDTFREW